jgi:hypothetical protein
MNPNCRAASLIHWHPLVETNSSSQSHSGRLERLFINRLHVHLVAKDLDLVNRSAKSTPLKCLTLQNCSLHPKILGYLLKLPRALEELVIELGEPKAIMTTQREHDLDVPGGLLADMLAPVCQTLRSLTLLAIGETSKKDFWEVILRCPHLQVLRIDHNL